MSNRKHIIYHGSCHDGITALWAALQSDTWSNAEPYEGVHSVPPDLDKLRDKDVLIVDFSYKRPEMTQLVLAARSVTVIDHHATAFDELVDSDKAQAWRADLARHSLDFATHFDMERSGAGLTWDLLHGPFDNIGPDATMQAQRSRERPLLINYVEDRDLWRFKLVNTRAIHAACNSYPTTLEARDILMKRNINSLIKEGLPVLRYHDKLALSIAKRARPYTIAGHVVPTVECASLELISDVCHNMLQDGAIPAETLKACSYFDGSAVPAFASAYWVDPKGNKVFSLRSDDDRMDVGEIAAKLGGGGHRNAAGYTEKA